MKSALEKDKASMSVRNKEICRLHMEETNSINNAQNPDSKIDTNQSNNTSESNKDFSDLNVKKEASPSLTEDTVSVSNADNSEPKNKQTNGSDVSDTNKDSCVVKTEIKSFSSDELMKNGDAVSSTESSDNNIDKPSNSESLNAVEPCKDLAKTEVTEPVKAVSKPVKEVIKPVKSVTKPNKEVVKSINEVSEPVNSATKPVEVAKPIEEVAKPVKEVTKPVKEESKNKQSSKQSKEKDKTKEEEAQSSGSEEFHGFDSDHTEKSIKARQEFIENSEENEVTSSAVPSTPSNEDINSKATPFSNKRMRKAVVDLSNPMFRKPFEFGWKRELVYRATNDDGKRQGDIYYYTPSRKKVRSAREVMEHITDPELSVDNFTFCKEPLGLNDPEKEIIRDAKIRLSKDFALTPPPKAVSRTPKAKATVTPVSPTPKATPKLVIKTPTPSSGGLKVKFTGIKSGSASAKSSLSKSKPAKVKKRKSSSGGSSELEMGMLPPMWSSPEIKSDSLSTARSWSPPTVSDSTKAEVDRSCSIYCPLAMGLIPSLQCHACQCLYHPECCGINPTRTVLQYICKKCQKNWNWKARTLASTTKSGNSITVSLPAPASTLVSVSNSTPGKIISASIKPKTAKITSIVGGVTTWLPPSSTIQFSSNNGTHNSLVNTPSIPRSGADNQITTPPAQTVVEMNGKRFIVMPKQNVVSVSQPTAVSNSLDTNPPAPVPVTAIQCFPRPQLVLSSSGACNAESLALAPISSPNLVAGGAFLPKSTPGLTPGTFLMSTQMPNPPGVLLVPCLPHQTTLGDNVAVQPQYVLVNSSGVGGNLMFANTLVQSSDDKENVGKKRSADKSEVKKGSPPTKKVKVEKESESAAEVGAVSTVAAPLVTTTTPYSMPAKFASSHYLMGTVASGYSSVMHIFRYLNLKELLIASRVCRLWNDVASKPHFWQTVRMKNTQVSDWNGFANALIKHETKHLDLRKMLVGSKPEEVKANWLEFYNVIARVKSLKRIELCRCQSSVIENLAKHVPHLESLTATAIKSPSLNLEPLGVITNLTELRLKGMSGLELTFDHLSSLSSLKLLSITAIKNLNDESSAAIGSLENLETLEIGDCNNINEKTVTEAIPKLINLKRLRLEKGQNSVPLIIQLIESASKLPQLEILELINFDVKPGFDVALGKCTNIKSLLMIPTYITQSATTNHIVMIGVSRLASTLKQFVWGLTLELLRVTDLFIDQCETSAKNSPAQSPNSNGNSAGNKKGKGDSIPILKPLIDTLEEGHDIKDPIPLTSSGPSKVDILPIPKLRKVLSNVLPTTDIKILKIPFSSTWRQTLV